METQLKRSLNRSIKRISIFILLLLFVSPLGHINAAINKKVDSFFDVIAIYSNTDNVSEFRQVTFIKRIQKDGAVDYGMIFATINNESWLFSKKNYHIKIDDTIYDMPVTATYEDILKGGRIHNSANTSIDQTIAAKLLNANEVAMRIYFTNRLSVTWQVPAPVLDEWRTVIKSDKSMQ